VGTARPGLPRRSSFVRLSSSTHRVRHSAWFIIRQQSLRLRLDPLIWTLRGLEIVPPLSRFWQLIDDILRNHAVWFNGLFPLDARTTTAPQAHRSGQLRSPAMQSRRATEALRAAGRTTIRTGAMATARWRPAPEVVIIGVKRGGTTSIFRDLERHPSMCPLVPSARRLPLRENMKGVHHFDTNAHRSDRWYRSHFPTSATRRLVERRTGESFTAEASPYYFFHPLGARRAALALPDTMFVVILRDPVDRTVSHWAEQTRNGVETMSLAEALDAESERVGDDAQRLSDGSLARSHAHEQQSYAAQSHYADSLQRWIDQVGRERLVVLFSEDYYRDPASTLAAITSAIGVTPLDVASGTHRNAAPRAGGLEPALDAALTERFRPDVERLTVILARQPPWPRFESEPSRADV
jgi:hypothetical protein